MADTPDAAAVQAAIERLRKINHADLTMRLIEGQSYKQSCCWYVDEVKAVVESLADACEHYQRELAEWHAIHGTENASEVADALKHVRLQRDEARAELAAALARERGLRRYTAHFQNCRKNPVVGYRCDCGLDAALAEPTHPKGT